MTRPHATPRTIQVADLVPFVVGLTAAATQLERLADRNRRLLLLGDAETALGLAAELRALGTAITAAAALPSAAGRDPGEDE